MSRADLLVVGGGVASAHAITSLLAHGIPGTRIMLVSADGEFPYHRPPLSKGYLLGREQREGLFVHPKTFYTQAGVRTLLGTTATALDPTRRIVSTSTGDTLAYQKLLLATGCTARTLTVPGSDLAGVYYLRTLADCDALKDALAAAKTAVVVGGSFIGMELASAFAQKGVQTALLHRGTAVFDKLHSPEAAAFFARYFSERGVIIRLDDESRAFERDGTGLRVHTKRGEVLPADLVAVGVGVVPVTDWLKDSGLVLENGVQVNERLEASLPDIFAAGDVANFLDPLYGRHRRVEHWDTAIQHGKLAGTNMAADPAQRKPYDLVSYFFSDVFDLSFDYFGDPTGTDRTIQRGSFDDRAVTLFFLENDIVRAAFTLGRPKERKTIIELIRSRQSLAAPDTLADTGRPLPASSPPATDRH